MGMNYYPADRYPNRIRETAPSDSTRSSTLAAVVLHRRSGFPDPGSPYRS